MNSRFWILVLVVFLVACAPRVTSSSGAQTEKPTEVTPPVAHDVCYVGGRTVDLNVTQTANVSETKLVYVNNRGEVIALGYNFSTIVAVLDPKPKCD